MVDFDIVMGCFATRQGDAFTYRAAKFVTDVIDRGEGAGDLRQALEFVVKKDVTPASSVIEWVRPSAYRKQVVVPAGVVIVVVKPSGLNVFDVAIPL